MWTWLIPVLSLALLVAAVIAGVGMFLGILCGAALIAAVVVAVHHAEVIAHRVGEPFGTLILALAVTAIEAALILSMMIEGGSDMAALPRDSIYAAVMIICNGVVGICVLLGGVAHREQTFRVEGAGVGIGALIVMSTLTLVLPVFTTSTPGGTYTTSQLAFVAVSSAALWAIFIFVQTVRHRDYFIPMTNAADPEMHAEPPTSGQAWISFGLLLLSLVTVVGLAKKLSPRNRARCRGGQRAQSRGWHCHCRTCSAARNAGRSACCPCKSTPKQHEPCNRFRARVHRSHRSRRGPGVDRLQAASNLRAGTQGCRAASADVPGQRFYTRYRSHLRAARSSPSGHVCGVSIAQVRSLSPTPLWNRPGYV
jgi:Sodium/calcium exchanger protein